MTNKLQFIYSAVFLLLLGLPLHSFSQVGVGTSEPEGILDLNSDTATEYYGFVLPRVALTSTVVAAPVTNPQGGSLAVGTVVYNTNTTNTGTNDVSPGVYMWDGIDWVNEFPRKHASIFKQSTYLRTQSNAGYQDIPGLVSQSFVPKYSGKYKIELNVNYGGGYVQNLAGGNTNPLSQKGNFKLTFDGTDTIVPVSCHSTYGDTQYYLIWEQATFVIYQDLTAGNSYSFSLQFDQLDSTGFVNNGNSGNGMGYIGYDIPCSVEFVFLD